MDKAPLSVFRGRVENGKLVLDNRDAFRALVARLEGKVIDIRLGKHRQPRSLSQNAYYWGVVIPIFAEFCGYENEELHEGLKLRFLKRRESESLPTVASTADLDTAQFTEYIEQVRRLAAEMGVVIPDPGEC